MDDLKLQAIDFLHGRYKRPLHTVAAALRTRGGKVYLGTNIDHFSGYVCAETSALAMAMNLGENDFSEIVSVRREADGTLGVANPCGKCRQILHDYAPGINILVSGDGGERVVSVEELLPYSFNRQREKIQAALSDDSASEVVG